MDEQNVKNEKKKELLNIYWFLLMVMAAVSLVNLLAISTDSMKAAAIVNVVLLFAIPLTFVLGYIDFRNFAPMSVKKSLRTTRRRSSRFLSRLFTSTFGTTLSCRTTPTKTLISYGCRCLRRCTLQSLSFACF